MHINIIKAIVFIILHILDVFLICHTHCRSTSLFKCKYLHLGANSHSIIKMWSLVSMQCAKMHYTMQCISPRIDTVKLQPISVWLTNLILANICILAFSKCLFSAVSAMKLSWCTQKGWFMWHLISDLPAQVGFFI